MNARITEYIVMLTSLALITITLASPSYPKWAYSYYTLPHARRDKTRQLYAEDNELRKL